MIEIGARVFNARLGFGIVKDVSCDADNPEIIYYKVSIGEGEKIDRFGRVTMHAGKTYWLWENEIWKV